MPNDPLPEGTDAVINGASATDGDFRSAIPLEAEPADAGLRARASAAASSLRDQAGERTAELRGQAGDKAREFAEQGKDKATAALDSVSRLIGDAAAQVDEKVGREYGDYARRAADAVDGLATSLRDRDVDQLFAEARELVRKSPAIAIGAAAVVGFALVRLVKAGAGAEATTTADATPPKKAPRAASGAKTTARKKA